MRAEILASEEGGREGILEKRGTDPNCPRGKRFITISEDSSVGSGVWGILKYKPLVLPDKVRCLLIKVSKEGRSHT